MRYHPEGTLYRPQKEVDMADVLIRGVPDEVLASIDAHAQRLGLSRVEYIRRRLATEVGSGAVSVEDLRQLSEACADLADESVMDEAWR